MDILRMVTVKSPNQFKKEEEKEEES